MAYERIGFIANIFPVDDFKLILSCSFCSQDTPFSDVVQQFSIQFRLFAISFIRVFEFQVNFYKV